MRVTTIVDLKFSFYSYFLVEFFSGKITVLNYADL